ncbi:MAG: MYXO-CTERM sorting domain-containing protein [Myxococcota bacterium]
MTDSLVRAHLHNVVNTLRAAPAPQGRADARAAALDALAAYAAAGRFPRPEGPVTPRARRISPPRAFRGAGARAPIFEDAAGTRCAVGHLLGLTRPDLVARVRDADNGVHLPELDLPELDAWAAENGLTWNELAWVQPGYCWEVPECDEVVLEAPRAVTSTCEGPDASLVGDMTVDCQVCDGPFRAWALVANYGTETASGVIVTLGSDTETFDQIEYGQLAPGESARVGPLEAPDVTSVNGIAWLSITSTGADCHPDAAYEAWEMGNGGPGHVAPAACGEGCPDDGGGCGCAAQSTSGWATLGWLGLAGLGLIRRRDAAVQP